MLVVEMLPWGDDLTEIDGGRINANSITTNELIATAIDGMIVTGATNRTNASGPRIEMNATRIYGFDGTTVQWEALATTGKLTAAAGKVVLDEDGIWLKGNALGLSIPDEEISWVRTAAPTEIIGSIGGSTNDSASFAFMAVRTKPPSSFAPILILAADAAANPAQTLLQATTTTSDITLHAFADNSPVSTYLELYGLGFKGLKSQTGTSPSGSAPNTWLDIAVSGNGEGAKVDNTFIGRGAQGSTYAHFSHWDNRNTTNKYAILQNSAGFLFLNAATGQSIAMRVNNSDVMTLSASAINPLVSLGTSWAGLSFGTGWSNYGSGYQTCQYKKVGDLIFVRGLATSGANLWSTYPTIGTLPAGYRPSGRLIFSADMTGAGRIDVLTSGLIIHVSGGGGSGYISLNDIVFSVD